MEAESVKAFESSVGRREVRVVEAKRKRGGDQQMKVD